MMEDEMERETDKAWLHDFVAAAEKGEVKEGYPAPDKWVEGIHFKLDKRNTFGNDELVLIGRSDGSRSIGRVRPPKHKDKDWFHLDLHLVEEYRIDVGKGLYKTVEKTGVGKLHECLRECLETKGSGKTVEEMCEALDEDKARFVARQARRHKKS